MAASRKTKTSAKPAAARKTTKKSSAAAKGAGAAVKKSTAKATPKRAAVAKKSEKAPKTVPTKPAKKERTPKPAAAAEESPEKPTKPVKPAKPAVDPELLKTIREALVSQRNQLLSVMHSTQAQLAEKETGMADVSDRASGGFEDELAMGLMQIEAAQIDDIEAAIERIDVGTYGVCVDCGKVIPRKRLEVLPFAQRCLDCEGSKERRARMQSVDSDDSDSGD